MAEKISFWSKLRGRFRDAAGAKSVTADGMIEFGDVLDIATTGQHVSAETSRNVATAYGCINVLSDDVGKLPLQTFMYEPGSWPGSGRCSMASNQKLGETLVNFRFFKVL